jgi:hypothetical protein
MVATCSVPSDNQTRQVTPESGRDKLSVVDWLSVHANYSGSRPAVGNIAFPLPSPRRNGAQGGLYARQVHRRGTRQKLQDIADRQGGGIRISHVLRPAIDLYLKMAKKSDS